MTKAELVDGQYISSKTAAIYDYAFDKALAAIPWHEWLMDSRTQFQCKSEFITGVNRWIHSTRCNSVQSLERFTQQHVIVGTTQAFDEAYFRYNNRRLRCFRGEYAYHRRCFKNFLYVEDAPLETGDWLIISWPFCSTGGQHPLQQATLDTARSLDVPVLLDCAYFGTCTHMQFDYSHPAIKEVCFSLTKGLGLGDFRIGIRYSDFSDNTPIFQQNAYQHLPFANMRIGLHMMNQFSPDFIPDKYLSSQRAICEKYGLFATNCMHLALGPAEWDDFKVDSTYVRVGIRNLVKFHFKHAKGDAQKNIPTNIICDPKETSKIHSVER